ncbi:MFS transporter [Nocardia sp. CNY236]|uniref:MFS transporter n=1 Tax=Nocardia sp. CNY236 TaxID=1169152 RepID=UPI001E2AE674|nr:MFS transporter [Nocardia sp. CNY236]
MSDRSHSPAHRPPKHRTDIRAPQMVLGAIFVAHALLFASWTAHIPLVMSQLGMTNAMLGTALLGAPLGSVAAMGVTGWLLPRVGSRSMIRITMVGYAFGSIGVGVAGSPTLLFGALAVWGFFQGALDVAMNTQAVTVENAVNRPIMARLHGMWSLGGFVGALIGAGVVAIGIDLTTQMIVLGLSALLMVEFLSTALLFDSTRRTNDPSRPLRRPDTGQRVPFWPILILGLLAFASMLCEGAAADWSAAYLRAELHTGNAVAGLGYAAFALAMVALRLTATTLQTRFAARNLIPTLAMLFAAGMVVSLVAAQPVIALIGFACMGAGLALVVPTAFSAVGTIGNNGTNSNAGRAISIVSALGWLGFVSGPPLIGYLAEWTSLTTALWVLPALALSIAAVARFGRVFRATPTPVTAGV